MGKTARKAKHASKMARKREMKAKRRSLYLSLAGTSKRKKRQGRSQGPTAQRGNHAIVNCGNVGCSRCFTRGITKFVKKHDNPPQEVFISQFKLGDNVRHKDGRVGEIMCLSAKDSTCIIRIYSKSNPTLVLETTSWLNQNDCRLEETKV